VAQRRKQAAGVELDALALVEPTRARQQRLEPVGVFLHGPGAATFRQLEQGRRAKRWAEAKVEEILEASPWRCTLVFLQLDGTTAVRCPPDYRRPSRRVPPAWCAVGENRIHTC